MLSFFIEMELKIPLLYFIITLKLIINSTMIPGDGNSSSNQCENLIPQKIQNRCNLYPCGDENCSGFHYLCMAFDSSHFNITSSATGFQLNTGIAVIPRIANHRRVIAVHSLLH